jgi:hypothetical protein
LCAPPVHHLCTTCAPHVHCAPPLSRAHAPRPELTTHATKKHIPHHAIVQSLHSNSSVAASSWSSRTTTAGGRGSNRTEDPSIALVGRIEMCVSAKALVCTYDGAAEEGRPSRNAAEEAADSEVVVEMIRRGVRLAAIEAVLATGGCQEGRRCFRGRQ